MCVCGCERVGGVQVRVVPKAGAFSSLTSIIEASGHTEELLEGQRSGDQDTDGAFRGLSVPHPTYTHTHTHCHSPPPT